MKIGEHEDTFVVNEEHPKIGWRVWRIVKNLAGMMVPELGSVYADAAWPYDEALEADAWREGGIHAFSRRRDAAEFGRVHLDCDPYVLGEVLLWGKVARHAHGYRAQFARPRLITEVHMLYADPFVAERMRKRIERRYCVPVSPRQLLLP